MHKSNETDAARKTAEAIPEKELEILYRLAVAGLSIHESVARTMGISAWFNAYLQSDEFTKLEKDFRADAFKMFEDLKDLLTFLEGKLSTIEPYADIYEEMSLRNYHLNSKP